LNDLELVRRQLDLVRDDLVKDGVPHDKAAKIVAAMLTSVQSKGLNDTILQSALTPDRETWRPFAEALV
jgi:hypothetical protein